MTRDNIIFIVKDHFDGYNIGTVTFFGDEPVIRVEYQHRPYAEALKLQAELHRIFDDYKLVELVG